MSRIRVYEHPEGHGLPKGCPESGDPVPLTVTELRALAESAIGDSREVWTRKGPDGSVWAGREGVACVAKVRGKNGRRLSCGRWPLPPEQKRATMSINITPLVRGRLEEMAAQEAARKGGRASISTIVEELVKRA